MRFRCWRCLSTAEGCDSAGGADFHYDCSSSGGARLAQGACAQRGLAGCSDLRGYAGGINTAEEQPRAGGDDWAGDSDRGVCGYSLLGERPPELKQDSAAWLLGCGFFAGVLGGAYGMNGPPLVIYGAMRRWSAQHFRATLQGYFLPASIAGMAGYWLTGLWMPAVTHYYLLSLPVLLPAVWLGRVVNHRLHGDVFLKYVYVGLAAIGVMLLVETLRR